MRNPHRALKKMSILQEAGNDMVRLWNGLAKDLPQAMEAPSGVSWIDNSWKNEPDVERPWRLLKWTSEESFSSGHF